MTNDEDVRSIRLGTWKQGTECIWAGNERTQQESS